MLVKALKEFDKLVPELRIELTTACDLRDEFSIAKELSISVLIFAAAGLCKLRIKYYHDIMMNPGGVKSSNKIYTEYLRERLKMT